MPIRWHDDDDAQSRYLQDWARRKADKKAKRAARRAERARRRALKAANRKR